MRLSVAHFARAWPRRHNISIAQRPSALVGCLLAVAFGGMLIATPVAEAQGKVQVKTKADGTKVIFSETSSQRTQRMSSRLRPIPQGSHLAFLIDHYARQYGLSPNLVQAVIQVESGYNSRALSSKGAMGLMQLMPLTAKDLGVSNAFDSDQNIRGGTRYLSQQIRRFSGSLSLALAAYNAGPSAVEKYGGIPPYRETQAYVKKVLALIDRAPSAPSLKDRTRASARRRQQVASAKAAEENKNRGKRVYLHRGENNRLVFTTTPPKTN